MTYLADTMIVSYFLQVAREKELATAAGCVPIAVVDEVRIELRNDVTRGGKAFDKWFSTSGIQALQIMVGSPAATTLAQLVPPGNPAQNNGERASIALAAFDATLTFVTHDKAGAMLALRELWAPGERLLGISVFLRRLFEAGAITDPIVLDDVMTCVQAKQRPTWWAAWRLGLNTPAQATPAAANGGGT